MTLADVAGPDGGEAAPRVLSFGSMIGRTHYPADWKAADGELIAICNENIIIDDIDAVVFAEWTAGVGCPDCLRLLRAFGI